MKTLSIFFILLFFSQLASAQRVFQFGGDLEIAEYGGLNFASLEDYYGEDAGFLEASIKQAIANGENDGFRFEQEKFNPWQKSKNSCADASNNLIDDIRGNNLLPDGASIKQIGTLGALTDFENTLGVEGEFVFDWWVNGEIDFQDFNRLEPPSYAHTLSLIELPNGNFYTIDNWKSGGASATIKRVYPIDSDNIFFTEDPNETDVSNSDFRIQKTDRGLCPGGNCDDPEEKSEVSPIPPTSEVTETEVLTSSDPNDKLGLRGIGSDRFIRSGRLMEYLIRFENMPDASAPAQEVLIHDTLDTQSYDLSTFELGDFTFGSSFVNVPEGLQRYSTRIPVLDDQFDLLITAGLVPETGIVTWKFTTIDPAINDLPFDPLDGFLPPNQNAPEGEGSVSFSVKAFNDLSDGHIIENEARIIFDLNEPIDTPLWSNTIDNTSPSSQVAELNGSQGVPAFDVSWSGDDAGAGIVRYDIFVAVNDGPFVIWKQSIQEREGRFVGQPDSTYSFFSIAYDAVGNSEPIKTEADASTSITVSTEEGVADLPMQYELFQNYPNPFNPSTVINYALPEASDVTIRIYDVMGRRIATLLNEKQTAGWHNVTWNAGSVASGTYFYRIQAGNFAAVKKLTLIK